ncbi:hypothetical protein EYZ11_011350 [Aspergillus tanneri]|uniref:Low affinity potassium transporter n=1 Tax=Aspergillus tanneri TaxID=1220188 RepID=A0A4S3J3M9_9EURO|nr:uncharacterized protein ATNIH1004_006668 [Aspergillus tanneri]KAA8645249.1 hypothetical protein ATNIH1004_006668 [Aspergillus tanneri]THC89202.1 hypothetical protein EYZ11_011350 [Aspergillus tanneri]
MGRRVDVKDLKTYQQLYIYLIPIISNLGFINILVVVVRLYWFEKRLKAEAPNLLRWRPRRVSAVVAGEEKAPAGPEEGDPGDDGLKTTPTRATSTQLPPSSIVFADDIEEDIHVAKTRTTETSRGLDQSIKNKLLHGDTAPLEHVVSMFVVGDPSSRGRRHQSQAARKISLSQQLDLPELSSQATLGQNSQFHNLTAEDREILGGIEYRSLKLLLKIVTGYFFGLHIFGAICLVGWIQHANPKYRQYLEECGQGSVWWGFYSAQTMVDNLGFTLTPDSMISFQDATFPMLLMSFLAFAGNTCYPCFLRLVIWVISKVVPRTSSLGEPLNFLLKHPRRCYTLLFPSGPTWALFGILFAMNFIDVILIIVLDLDNSAVNNLAPGPRILAAIFQAASSRHTGTSTFNLADVNPAVQFSLVVMMYIAIFPIAISIRASNTYEEKALGKYPMEDEGDENNSRSYILTHIRNQLTFDLWYIFLGAFCICIAEADRIMNVTDPAFSVFSVLFEVTSAYGNVGLSLGYPTVMTSLSGEFTTFSKVVICAMMIRGRHRGLPYQLDRAILLPNERLAEDSVKGENLQLRQLPKFSRYHTS